MKSNRTLRLARQGLALAALLAPANALAQPAPPPPGEAPSPDPPPPPPPGAEVDPEEAFFGDDAEDEFFGDGEGEEDKPPEPPAKGKGVVVGTVTDATGLPAVQAQVKVVGKSTDTYTTISGTFRLELPPGKYTLRILYPLHEVTVLAGVVVEEGGQVALTEQLSQQKGTVLDPIEVEVEADLSSVEGQLLTRKRAAVVGDAISRTEMSKTPDRNAAAAVRRVVGVLIIDGKYVYVRGIGERYTNALLDGSPLPSPEPEQQTVPLDLFPTNVLDSLTVVKTFTPDMPGNFAGGSVRIGTRRLPKEFVFSMSGSVGLNTYTTFTKYLQSPGGDLDFLGFDDGTRALPEELPPYRVGRPRNDDGSFRPVAETDAERLAAGRAIDTPMSTNRILAPVNHNFSATIGNTFDLDDEQKLGVQLSAGYRRNFQRWTNEILRTADPLPGEDTFFYRNDYRAERGIDSVRWNALGGLTYQIDEDHKVHLTGLWSVSTDDEARELEGRDRERNNNVVHETRLTYEQRNLAFAQLRGEHEFDDLEEAALDWNLSLARATRDQPNTRATVFQLDPGFGYSFEDDSQSGFHFYSELEELTLGGGWDWTQPFSTDEDATKLKLGSRVDVRRRTFSARRFSYEPTVGPGGNESVFTCPEFPYPEDCPDRIFADENIGPNGQPQWMQLGEDTLDTDAYDATYDVFAGYVMTDVHLADNLRFIGGARLEVGSQTITSFLPFAPDDEEGRDEGGTRGEDLLPAGSLVWEVVENMNLRAAVSRTVARPQLREIAPFVFTNYFGGNQETGNPNLEFTRIWNGDLRWEWFPTLREVLAASLFAKRFEKPIEQVIQPQGSRGIITYQNAPGGNLIGGELEARKHLGFLYPAQKDERNPLEDISVIANVTVAFSEVSLNPGFNTNQVRPMVNQAPWIVNAAVDYDNQDVGLQLRLLYNIFGSRIVQVGAGGMPDVYEQPRHQIDVTFSQQLGQGFQLTGSAKNILNDDFRSTFTNDDTDDNLARRYRTGQSFSIGARYAY